MRLIVSALAAVALNACVSTHAGSPQAHASAPTRGPVFPDMGAAAPLDLTDAVTDTPLLPELNGKVVLVSFIATTCKDSCPLIESKFTRVQTKLARDGYLGTRVQLVLVGIDPLEDTQQGLASKALSSHAVRGSFHYATGSPTTMQRLLSDYGIEVMFKGTSHVDPDHTLAIYLIDPSRRIRYDFAMFYPPDEMGRIAEQLADETTPGRT
jgi:cytochrome oxidase Cu insertion factor (SCO1/SenC/PrrC family)